MLDDSGLTSAQMVYPMTQSLRINIIHSTETALLKVHNDINLNIDNGKVTALTLLDLSAAVDTTDHDIFVTRLSTWYGISGTALSWFSSYLTDRRQAIKIGNCFLGNLPTFTPGFCFGALAVHCVYNTTKLCYPESVYADDTHMYVS